MSILVSIHKYVIISTSTTNKGQNMKSIVVTTRNVYGQEKIYPVCEHAHMLAELAGTKTFTDHAIRLIKKMGIQIALEELKPSQRYI